jgi:hypothetical protein
MSLSDSAFDDDNDDNDDDDAEADEKDEEDVVRQILHPAISSSDNTYVIVASLSLSISTTSACEFFDFCILRRSRAAANCCDLLRLFRQVLNVDVFVRTIFSDLLA